MEPSSLDNINVDDEENISEMLMYPPVSKTIQCVGKKNTSLEVTIKINSTKPKKST